jgi:hypothetical protein
LRSVTWIPPAGDTAGDAFLACDEAGDGRATDPTTRAAVVITMAATTNAGAFGRRNRKRRLIWRPSHD